MRLDEWDKRIGPRLQDIEYSSKTIARHARYIQANARNLPARPAWETLARAALDDAEAELRIGLAVVQATRSHYDALQVIAEAAE